MTTKQCKYCGNDFTPQRSTALFCCDKCRSAYHQKQKKLTDDTTEINSPPPLKMQAMKQENDTLNEDQEFDKLTKILENMDVEGSLRVLHLRSWMEKCQKAITALIKPKNHSITLAKMLSTLNSARNY